MFSTLHRSSFRHKGVTAGFAVAALALGGLMVPLAQGRNRVRPRPISVVSPRIAWEAKTPSKHPPW